jgi:hypothetical protein
MSTMDELTDLEVLQAVRQLAVEQTGDWRSPVWVMQVPARLDPPREANDADTFAVIEALQIEGEYFSDASPAGQVILAVDPDEEL